MPSVDASNRLAWFPLDSNSNDVDNNLTLTLSGAQIGLTDKKFGAGAMQMTASGHKGTIADHAQLNTGGPCVWIFRPRQESVNLLDWVHRTRVLENICR